MSTNQTIDNRELYAEIMVSKGKGRLTHRATKLLIILAHKAIRKMPYYNPDDRDDCVQTGLEMIFKNWHNFNPDKFTNAFAYFTEVFKRGIAQGFNELHRKRGEDKTNKIRTVSINSSNDGAGMFNL